MGAVGLDTGLAQDVEPQRGRAGQTRDDGIDVSQIGAIDSWYPTIEDDTAALRTRDLIGAETLLWGSDYPHTDSTWPCSTQVLDEMFEGYSAETRDKITRTNVANLYSL